MRLSWILVLVALAGCTTTSGHRPAETRGFEQGYQQAVKEQYWIIQNQQRAATTSARESR